MTELLPEFSSLPVRGVFDGELVAFANDRLPSFDRLRRRMLQRDASVPVALVLFDVLEVDGEPRLQLPYIQRREIFESLTFGLGRHVTPRYDDGEVLWKSVLAHGPEGVVAKRLSEPYRPGEGGWIKRKNRAWCRYESEHEAAMRERQRRSA